MEKRYWTIIIYIADEWNGIPRKSHDLEIVGSTPVSAISEFHGSQINIFSDSPHPESKYKNRGYATIAQMDRAVDYESTGFRFESER